MQLKPCSFLEKSTLTFVPSYHYCLNDIIYTFECLDAEKSGCEINIYELSLICPSASASDNGNQRF